MRKLRIAQFYTGIAVHNYCMNLFSIPPSLFRAKPQSKHSLILFSRPLSLSSLLFEHIFSHYRQLTFFLIQSSPCSFSFFLSFFLIFLSFMFFHFLIHHSSHPHLDLPLNRLFSQKFLPHCLELPFETFVQKPKRHQLSSKIHFLKKSIWSTRESHLPVQQRVGTGTCHSWANVVILRMLCDAD